jgi:hypothetical protein
MINAYASGKHPRLIIVVNVPVFVRRANRFLPMRKLE